MRYRHTVQRPEGIVKDKGVAPYEFEEEVAEALFDIEVSPSSEIKCDLCGNYISVARQIEVKPNQKAVVVYFLLCVEECGNKNQGRLIRDLEKTFNKKHLVSWHTAQFGTNISDTMD